MKLSRFPLAALLDSASGQLEAHLLHKKESAPRTVAGTPAYAGIIFSGNPHEAVPRRLLLDDRLTPLERNTWQVFRMLINGDGVTAFPTYDQLRPYLGMQPGKPASRETISKSLVTLRLTRWLSLGRRVRNDLSGQVQGNVYLLHDEPVSPAEAIELDKDYLQLLNQSMQHPNKAIREVAEIAWNEFAADPDVGERLPTRLDKLVDRLCSQRLAPIEKERIDHQATEFGIRTQQTAAESPLSSDSEPCPNSRFMGGGLQSSESELSLNPQSSVSVRNPNSYSTYTNTYQDVCKSSVPVPPEESDVSAGLLQAVHRLPPDQKQNALEALQKVPPELKPALLTQWVHRMESGSLRNPLGYLLTLVSSAVRGEFNSSWTPHQAPAAGGRLRTEAGVKPDSRPEVVRGSNGLEAMPTPTHVRTPEAIAAAQHEISAMISQLRCGRSSAQ